MIDNSQADHIKFNADMESDMPMPAMVEVKPDLGPIERMMAEFGKTPPMESYDIEIQYNAATVAALLAGANRALVFKDADGAEILTRLAVMLKRGML